MDQNDSGAFPKENQDTAASGALAGRPLELCPEVLKSLLLQGRWPAQEAARARLGVCISLVCRQAAVNQLQKSKHALCLFGKLGDSLCPMSNPFACQRTSPLGFLVPINLWDLIPLPNRHGVTSKKQNLKHCAAPRKSPRHPAVLGRSKAWKGLRHGTTLCLGSDALPADVFMG